MTNLLRPLAVLSVALNGVSLSRLEREEGQTLAEYALILALIALLVTGAIFFLRTQITSLFSDIGNKI